MGQSEYRVPECAWVVKSTFYDPNPATYATPHWSSGEDKSIRLTTYRWPSWNMYVQNTGDGNARGWYGDAGVQGRFYLERRTSDDGQTFFTLRSVRWPDWYV